ncbi:hypothetical protein DPMN_075305 [Dreissena polymorpha]|uniref:Uncharacterized protein n=1 Tax=Dreissena polymorpha TaxID=45954 RepID=A0A9D3YK82_DREPO|nr:hypothetical protein DPMN_075305 [Dreissena polymorpha]
MQEYRTGKLASNIPWTHFSAPTESLTDSPSSPGLTPVTSLGPRGLHQVWLLIPHLGSNQLASDLAVVSLTLTSKRAGINVQPKRHKHNPRLRHGQIISPRRPNRVFTRRIAVAFGIDPRNDAESVLTSRTFAE